MEWLHPCPCKMISWRTTTRLPLGTCFMVCYLAWTTGFLVLSITCGLLNCRFRISRSGVPMPLARGPQPWCAHVWEQTAPLHSRPSLQVTLSVNSSSATFQMGDPEQVTCPAYSVSPSVGRKRTPTSKEVQSGTIQNGTSVIIHSNNRLRFSSLGCCEKLLNLQMRTPTTKGKVSRGSYWECKAPNTFRN